MRSGARNFSAWRTRLAMVSGGIDLAGRDIDAAQADLQVLTQFAGTRPCRRPGGAVNSIVR